MLDEEEQERTHVEQQIPGVCAEFHAEQRAEEEGLAVEAAAAAIDEEEEATFAAEEEEQRDLDEEFIGRD